MGSSSCKVYTDKRNFKEIQVRCVDKGDGDNFRSFSSSMDSMGEPESPVTDDVSVDYIDVFFVHCWDRDDVESFERMQGVNDILLSRGLTTWCNYNRVNISIDCATPALEKSKCVLLMLSKHFLEEVTSSSRSTSVCRSLLLAAAQSFDPRNIFAAVLDAECLNKEVWGALWKQCLGKVKMWGLTTDIESHQFLANIESVLDAISLRIDRPCELIHESFSDEMAVASDTPVCISSKSESDDDEASHDVLRGGEDFYCSAMRHLETNNKREALRWMKLAALDGHTDAQFMLGEFYTRGEVCAPNPLVALQWYRRAALTGNLAAHHSIGLCYLKGVGVAQNMVEAVKWFTISANNCFAKSQYALGQCHIYGYGVDINEGMGLQWLRKASANGYIEAMLALAEYLRGLNDAREHYSEIYALYRQAATLGNIKAQYQLGLCSLHGTGVVANAEDAFQWFNSAASRGLAEAQYELANCYADGIGVDQSDADAVYWCRLAADQCHAKAQYSLAVCYSDGIGVDKNEQTAIDWCRLAAAQGNPQAQHFLGNCYLDGIGTLKDEREAIKWYTLAADKNYAESQHSLGDCYRLGYGVSVDHRKALNYYTLSALHKMSESQFRLGECYFYGLGAARNVPEAINWFQRAAKQNHSEAEYILSECFLHGTGVQRDESAAMRYCQQAADHGHAKAQSVVAMHHLTSDKTTALEYLQKSAAQGYAEAQYQLSVLFLDENKDDKRTINDAVDWCRLAADQNHSEAQFCMGNFYSNGIGVERNYRRAMFWYAKAADNNHLRARSILNESNTIPNESCRNVAQDILFSKKKKTRFSF